MKSYTDLEQSRKLAEILPIESADMEYILEQWRDEETHRLKKGYSEYPVVKVDDDDDQFQVITLPCWSLAALMELLPSELELHDTFETTKFEIRIRKYNHIVNGLNLYQIAYGNNKGRSYSWHDLFNTSEHENLLDAVFEMVCYLKENKFI